MITLTCPSCRKPHEVDAKTFDHFGPDAECMKCIDWAHVDFMSRNARKFKMSCVKDCRCGYGPGGRNASC